MTYRTIDAKHVQRVEDGAFVPLDPDNRDFQEYAAWLKAGGSLLPAPVPIPDSPSSLEIALFNRGILTPADVAAAATIAPADLL